MCACGCAQLVSDNCLLFPKDCLYLSLSVFGNHGNKCHSNSGKSKPGRWAAERKWERMQVCALLWYKQPLKTWICFIFCWVRKWNMENHKVAFHATSDLLRPSQSFWPLPGTESQDYFSKALKVAVCRPLVHHTSLELFNLIPLVGLKHLQHGCCLLIGEGIVTDLALYLLMRLLSRLLRLLFLHFWVNQKTCLKEYSGWFMLRSTVPPLQYLHLWTIINTILMFCSSLLPLVTDSVFIIVSIII